MISSLFFCCGNAIITKSISSFNSSILSSFWCSFWCSLSSGVTRVMIHVQIRGMGRGRGNLDDARKGSFFYGRPSLRMPIAQSITRRAPYKAINKVSSFVELWESEWAQFTVSVFWLMSIFTVFQKAEVYIVSLLSCKVSFLLRRPWFFLLCSYINVSVVFPGKPVSRIFNQIFVLYNSSLHMFWHKSLNAPKNIYSLLILILAIYLVMVFGVTSQTSLELFW